jgi:hypothetical protein
MPPRWMSGWRGRRGEDERREEKAKIVWRTFPYCFFLCMGVLLPPHSAPVEGGGFCSFGLGPVAGSHRDGPHIVP